MVTPAQGWIINPNDPTGNSVVRDPNAGAPVMNTPVVSPPANPSTLQGTMVTPTPPPTPNIPAPSQPSAANVQPATPQTQTAQTAPGAGLDPASFMNVLNGVKQNFAANNDLINAKNLLLKGLFTSPLTQDQIAQLPPDIQQVYKSGNRDAQLLQVQALNERIQGGTTNYAQSINYLVNGYQTAVDQAQKQKQAAIDTLFKVAQNFVDPKTGTINTDKMQAALESLYPGVDLSGIVSQLNGMVPTSAYNSQLHYGSNAESNFTVNLPTGTIASQTNNPLNIKYVPNNDLGAQDSGIVAKDGGTFAAFASPEDGLNAAIKLLQSDAYSNLTIDQAMKKWSNNGYGADVSPTLNPNQKVGSLSDSQLTQLVNDMAKRESGASITEVPTDTQIMGQSLVDGTQAPSLISAYGGARNKAITAAKRIDPNFDANKAEIDYQAAKKWVAAMNSTQMVRYQGLAGSVVNTIQNVEDLAAQMKNSGVPALNAAKIAAYIQTEGNSPKGQLASQYLAAVNTLKEEFANLANGGYAPTDAAWSLANSQINGNYGVDQLTASLEEVQRLINYRLNSIGSVQPVTLGGNEFGVPGPASSESNTTDPNAIFDQLYKQYGGQ